MSTILNISCKKEFVERLNRLLPSQQRSRFIVDSVTKALDEREELDAERLFRKKVFEQSVVPAVKSCWVLVSNPDEILSEAPERRDGLRKKVSKKLGREIGDDELLKAMRVIIREDANGS